MALTGMLGRLRIRNLGTTMLMLDALAGLLLVPLGMVNASWQGVVLLLLGSMSGFMQIAVFTWIQRRVPGHMLGRAMSIFMFIFMGLAPMAAARTDAAAQHHRRRFDYHSWQPEPVIACPCPNLPPTSA